LWQRSIPAKGTAAERYLISRGISLETLPTTVRYLPPRPPRHVHAAMIVPFGIPGEPEPGLLHISAANINSVHLTFLQPDGSGKAECDPDKITIGPRRGMPMVLAPPNDGLGLVIAEGVEEALSVNAVTGLGAWAAGGTSCMPALADGVPAYIDIVTIAADPEPRARRDAQALADRLVGRGIAVEIQTIEQIITTL
jgi:hypothetical protein